MKGILICQTFLNVNFNVVLEVAGTVKIRGFDVFMVVNQEGRGVDTELFMVAH